MDAVLKAVDSVAETDVIYRFQRLVCFRTHSSCGAARCACFSGPAGGFSRIPFSPPPALGLHRAQLQGSFHPGSAAGHISLALALVVGSFGSA